MTSRTRARAALPLALAALLATVGCIGSSGSYTFQGYEESTIVVASLHNRADEPVTVRVVLVDDGRTVAERNRTLEAGADVDAEWEIVCPRTMDQVRVELLDPATGEQRHSETLDRVECRSWPTRWDLTVEAGLSVEMNRQA